MTTETLSIALTAIGMAAALPCQWEGDTEQTPIDMATMFPAEYEYLKAKFGQA